MELSALRKERPATEGWLPLAARDAESALPTRPDGAMHCC